jgi:hypothetical protein
MIIINLLQGSSTLRTLKLNNSLAKEQSSRKERRTQSDSILNLIPLHSSKQYTLGFIFGVIPS